ncbi:MAG: glycosyltransferase [Solirubrobacteraceae bacterium MAG38_C4-C5]|nr:glycosyltransferase [Candidatus Siliceabacter maunaloa]
MEHRDPPKHRPPRPDPPRHATTARTVAVLLDTYPALSETFVVAELAALDALGHRIRIEARELATTPNAEAVNGIPTAYAFEDTTVARLRSVGRLAVRHPLRCARDLVERRRWRREEPILPLRTLAPVAARLRAHRTDHLHVHFATGPAADALRLSRVLGLSCSIIAHGWEIFGAPANLRAKLAAADLALAPCQYTARHLRGLTGREVEVVVMGVDGERFRRGRPHPGGRHVVAVGRLVAKKGFEHLVDAVAVLERAGTPVDRCTIVGEGPLRARLEEQVRRLGLDGRVVLAGACQPDGVRAVLEDADLLAMPCVVAADGDRDAMPVVVKEALAMEVPVVASDEVGLPELVDHRWGRLVPPGDPGALAAGIGDLLDLPASARAAMGRAGRKHVLRACDVHAQTARLSRLIEGLGASAP